MWSGGFALGGVPEGVSRGHRGRRGSVVHQLQRAVIREAITDGSEKGEFPAFAHPATQVLRRRAGEAGVMAGLAAICRLILAFRPMSYWTASHRWNVIPAQARIRRLCLVEKA